MNIAQIDEEIDKLESQLKHWRAMREEGVRINNPGRRIYSKEEQRKMIEENQDIVFHQDGYIYATSAGH